MHFKNFEFVLVLANRPAGAPSIMDWRPFGGATLNEIIDKYNNDYVEYFRTIAKWTDQDIEEKGKFLAVANYDLSEVERIDFAKYSTMTFVFANLEDISSTWMAAEHVKRGMNYAHQVYYLVQLSKPLRPSERDRFLPSFVLPSRPQVIDDQVKLEEWLAGLGQIHRDAIDGATPPPNPGGGGGSGGPHGPGGRAPSGHSSGGDSSIQADLPAGKSKSHSWTQVLAGYRADDLTGFKPSVSGRPRRSLMDIATEVRDIAYQKRLSREETKALARKAVLQEEFLEYVRASVVHNLDLKTDDVLILDGLRKPMEQITINDSYFPVTDTIELLTVKLAEPIITLSREQSKLCSDLRLNKQNSRAIFVGRPETLKTIEKLKSTVETRLMRLSVPFDATDLLL